MPLDNQEFHQKYQTYEDHVTSAQTLRDEHGFGNLEMVTVEIEKEQHAQLLDGKPLYLPGDKNHAIKMIVVDKPPEV